jgi:hypothetical protein
MTRPTFEGMISAVPPGLHRSSDLVPALKRRSIISRTFGAQMQPTYFASSLRIRSVAPEFTHPPARRMKDLATSLSRRFVKAAAFLDARDLKTARAHEYRRDFDTNPMHGMSQPHLSCCDRTTEVWQNYR